MDFSIQLLRLSTQLPTKQYISIFIANSCFMMKLSENTTPIVFLVYRWFVMLALKALPFKEPCQLFRIY